MVATQTELKNTRTFFQESRTIFKQKLASFIAIILNGNCDLK